MCSNMLRETPKDIYTLLSKRTYDFNIKESHIVKQILSALNLYDGENYIFFCENDHLYPIINKLCLNYMEENNPNDIQALRETFLKMSYEEKFINLINDNTISVTKYNTEDEKESYTNRLALITSLFKDKQ